MDSWEVYTSYTRSNIVWKERTKKDILVRREKKKRSRDKTSDFIISGTAREPGSLGLPSLWEEGRYASKERLQPQAVSLISIRKARGSNSLRVLQISGRTLHNPRLRDAGVI